MGAAGSGSPISGEDIQAGDVSGTPSYMAPEQFAGTGASVQSDIHAFGSHIEISLPVISSAAGFFQVAPRPLGS